MNKLESDSSADELPPDVQLEATTYHDQLWMEKYRKLEAFREAFGHCNVTLSYEDKSLAMWVRYQRYQQVKGTLRKDREQLLNDLEFTRKTNATWTWMNRYEQLLVFQAKHGHFRVPSTENKVLQDWVNCQRRLYREGRLHHDRKELLDKVEFVWDPTRVSSSEDVDDAISSDVESPDDVEENISNSRDHGNDNIFSQQESQDNVGNNSSFDSESQDGVKEGVYKSGDDHIPHESETRDIVEAVARAPAAATAEVNISLPVTQHNIARVSLESSNIELDVSETNSNHRSSVIRPSKRQRRQPRNRDDHRTVAPDPVPSVPLELPPRNLPSKLDRLKLKVQQQKHKWEVRKGELMEHSAQLDVDIKRVELARQELAYRMELHTHYMNLKKENCSYAEIAEHFPAMIEFFPQEEKEKLENAVSTIIRPIKN